MERSNNVENTEQFVRSFREKTVELLKCFDIEDYEKLQQLLDERQQIINTFEQNPKLYIKEQIAAEFRKTDIAELDKQAELLIKTNMEEIKEKLQTIGNADVIKNKYNIGFSGNPLFFNKKIY